MEIVVDERYEILVPPKRPGEEAERMNVTVVLIHETPPSPNDKEPKKHVSYRTRVGGLISTSSYERFVAAVQAAG